MHRALSVVPVVVLTACPVYVIPPDVDTSDSTSSDDGGGELTVTHDGLGDGRMVPVRLHNGPDDWAFTRHAIVIGAANEDWSRVSRAGQLSILLDNGEATGTPGGVLAAPFGAPPTIVEDAHSAICGSGQRFAWDLLPDRRLGGALSFFFREAWVGSGDFQAGILAAAPTAADGSGRVLTYLGCSSCALFPKPDGDTPAYDGAFGTAVDVGWFTPGVEQLVVGAPMLGGGAVAIIPDFDRWDFDYWEPANKTGVRECQCSWRGGSVPNIDCGPWSETLTGSFGEDEEFGAALAVADLDCDGLDDLVIGAPGADLPTMDEPLVDAGAVYVYFNDGGEFGGSAPTILRQGSLETGGDATAGDRFGAMLAVGNFNGARREDNDKSCFDLVVGTPGEGEGAGQIQVFEGGPEGLVYGGPVIDLDDVFGGTADPGDQFGWAMVSGDLNRNKYDELVIGAPGDELGGSITIIPGSPQGIRLDDATWFRQGDGVAGNNEDGDQLGFALTWSHIGLASGNDFYVLVAGAPGEDAERGAVYVYRLSELDGMFGLGGDTIITQSMIEGDEMPGDRFGATLLRPRAVPEVPDW